MMCFTPSITHGKGGLVGTVLSTFLVIHKTNNMRKLVRLNVHKPSIFLNICQINKM